MDLLVFSCRLARGHPSPLAGHPQPPRQGHKSEGPCAWSPARTQRQAPPEGRRPSALLAGYLGQKPLIDEDTGRTPPARVALRLRLPRAGCRSRTDVCLGFVQEANSGGGNLRPAKVADALEVLAEAGRHHLVTRPFADRAGKVMGICVCCDCHCAYFRDPALVGTCAPGRLVAVSDEATCDGCGVCVPVCYFGARSKEGALVDPARCAGCGPSRLPPWGRGPGGGNRRGQILRWTYRGAKLKSGTSPGCVDPGSSPNTASWKPACLLHSTANQPRSEKRVDPAARQIDLPAA